MVKLTRRSLIGRLDNLAREICKIQADYTCQRCGMVGGSTNIQWAHIEARRKKSIRWDERNCLALCAGVGTNSCHYWFDNNKIASSKWLSEKFPEKYNWLHEEVEGKPRSEALFKESVKDLMDLEVKLKARLEELK